MGQIVLGVVGAVVLSAVFGFWRRHHKDKARPVERLIVGLLATVGGVVLVCLVAFVMPAVLAYVWMDITGIFLKLAIFMVGSILALAGVRLVTTSIGAKRAPRE